MYSASDADSDVTVHLHSTSGVAGGDKCLIHAANDMQLQLQQYGSNLTSFARGMSELNRMNQDPHRKFTEMRDKVNTLAVWYVQGPFQKAISVVQDLTSYAETYTALDFDTFCSEISAVAEVVAEYKQNVDSVAKEHLEALMQSQQLARDAAETTEELNDEVNLHEQNAQALAAKVERHAAKENKAERDGEDGATVGAVAIGVAGATLALPPVAVVAAGVGVLGYGYTAITSAVASYHNKKQVKAQKKCLGTLKQAQDARTAVQLIEGRLVPYINNFSTALQQLSSCFSVLASDVERFGNMANNSKQLSENRGRMKLHFIQMRSISTELFRCCKSLTAATYQAREELKALPGA